jgi:hypothetical protein
MDGVDCCGKLNIIIGYNIFAHSLAVPVFPGNMLANASSDVGQMNADEPGANEEEHREVVALNTKVSCR